MADDLASVSDARTDLERTREALDVLARRWSVWVLQTLEQEALRYVEIHHRLKLDDTVLSPCLHRLTNDGLLTRLEMSANYVQYRLADRGKTAMKVAETAAAWGRAHLSPASGNGQRGLAQDAESTLALIASPYITGMLWRLRERGTCTAADLADVGASPGSRGAVYERLHRAAKHGLVERIEGYAAPRYRLTRAGADLGPVYGALTNWAAGRSLPLQVHPVWGRQPKRATYRRPVPVRATRKAPPAWQPEQLFSHRPLPATGRCR